LEYLIGAAITMASYIITNRLVSKKVKEEKIFDIRYSQSHIYELMRPFLEFTDFNSAPSNSQSVSFLKKTYMKVMVVKNRAYWIKDNTFYTADVVNGEVQKETTKEVDTMGMDRVELNEMIFIVEKLRGENDDNWSSGK
jgi:hypothetical protein